MNGFVKKRKDWQKKMISIELYEMNSTKVQWNILYGYHIRGS